MLDQLNALLILLCRLISTRRLYFQEHPKVLALSNDFLNALRRYFQTTKNKSLFVGILNDKLVFEGKKLVGPSLIGRQLFHFAACLKCGGILFTEHLTTTELTVFINLAANLEKPLASLDEARNLMIQNNIHNIEISPHYTGPVHHVTNEERTIWEGQGSEDEGGIPSATLIYQALFDSVAQAHEDVHRGRSVDFTATRSVSEHMLHFTRDNFSDLLQHVQYPDHDTYTVGHSVRVAALAVYFANCYDWPKELVLAIGTAGLMHDIGKSLIPAEILHKPARLTDEEFSRMSTHSRLGAEILLAHPESTELDLAAAWGHHIKNDGGGYPQKPSWAVRHPLTALLQICDVFEALTATRPYKPPLTPHMAYGIMLKDGGSFHLNLLASFISVVGLYPPGNRVLLSDSSRAIVTAVGDKIDRPVVRLTHTAAGDELDMTDQHILKLDDKRHHHISVKKLLQGSEFH